MNLDKKDDLDRAIDEALASMVGGEPRRVSAASVRQAAGESRSSRLPIWFAAAAVLIVGLAVALRARAPLEKSPVEVAQSSPLPAAIEVRTTPSPAPTQVSRTAPSSATGSRRFAVATTTEPVYEGLPRLTIALIDLPEPLRPTQMDADPLQIPRIEITPLAVSSLSNEQEHN